jgi:hypothetical protein
MTPFEIPQELVDELAAPLRKLFALWLDELTAHERAVAAVEMVAGSTQPDGEALGSMCAPQDWPWLRAQLRSRTELMAAVSPAVDAALRDGERLTLDQDYIDSLDDDELRVLIDTLATDVEVDALAIRHICRSNGLNPEA